MSTPLRAHFKLSIKQGSSNEAEKTYLRRVSYASPMSNLIYAMVCTRLDIVHVVGTINYSLLNPHKEYYIVKWILRYLGKNPTFHSTSNHTDVRYVMLWMLSWY